MGATSNNLTLSAMQLKTTKATGLKTTSSNVVENLNDHVEEVLGEVYWSVSSMTQSDTGRGNTKKIVYYTNNNNVLTTDPYSGIDVSKQLQIGETAIMACKALYNDYDYGIARVDESEIDIVNPSNSIYISLTNPFSENAIIDAVAYRCPSSGKVSAAMITTVGVDSILSYTQYPGSQFDIDITKELGSTQYLFVNDLYASVVEVKADGNIIVTRVQLGTSTVVISSMQTTGLTGKICDPFATNPIFYGYKSDGLYSVTGTGIPVKVVNTNGITGIAVFTKYGSGCETGYIYREAGGDCRDNTGKRTDPVVGTMINDYNFNLVKMNVSVEVQQLQDESVISG